jgi:hypothetical protein
MARARPTELTRPWAPAAALAATGVYALGVLAVDPFKPHTIGCPIHAITGAWCPGCGSTRAADMLLHGDVLSSLSYNMLVLPALLLLAWWWTGWAIAAWRGDRPRWAPSPTTHATWMPNAIGGVVCLFAITRNLSAFAWLAP